MAGESSVISGEHGHKIVAEILNLIGWKSPAEHFDFSCSLETNHKKEANKKGRMQHGVDLLFQYPSPLISANHDIVIISSKHYQKKYTNILHNAQNFLFDLAQDLECAKLSDEIHEIVERTDKNENYQGVLFWLASEEDNEFDIVSKLSKEIEFKNTKFNSIFLVDNKRATFLVSAIKTAQAYREGVEIKFLYPHTGKNMHPDNLLITDSFLPVQYINSELIPIVMDDNNKISCLLFCNDIFHKESLKRLIWLSHKLCGLTNEIIIYFRDYDATKHKVEVNAVKQLFRDGNLIHKISIRQFTSHNFVNLKENQGERSIIISDKDQYVIKKSQKVYDDIDKILPYGEMLLPRLSSPILTKKRLKRFLSQKGIFLNTEDKQETVPLFASLLLSPRELNHLKDLYLEKEDTPKEIERIAKWSNSEMSLWQAINQIGFNIKNINPTKNSKIVENPRFTRIENDNNNIEVRYVVEKQNTTKDLLTGITRHDAVINLTLKNGKLTAKMQHTSHETYKSNIKIFTKLEQNFTANSIIEEKFEKITFGHFENNNERMLFLLSFLHTDNIPFIEDGDIENIKIRPDNGIDGLPEDLASMQGKVSNLNISGKLLDKLHYIKKKNYRDYLHCERIKIRYKFKCHIGEGHCTVDFGFPGALSKNTNFDSEFQTSIWINDSKTIGMNYNSAIRFLNKEIRKLRLQKYNNIIKKRENNNH